MSKLTEGTLLPLSLVILIFTTAVTIGVTYQKVEAHQTRLDKQRLNIDELAAHQLAFQKEIIDRLARIETKLDAKNK